MYWINQVVVYWISSSFVKKLALIGLIINRFFEGILDSVNELSGQEISPYSGTIEEDYFLEETSVLVPSDSTLNRLTESVLFLLFLLAVDTVDFLSVSSELQSNLGSDICLNSSIYLSNWFWIFMCEMLISSSSILTLSHSVFCFSSFLWAFTSFFSYWTNLILSSFDSRWQSITTLARLLRAWHYWLSVNFYMQHAFSPASWSDPDASISSFESSSCVISANLAWRWNCSLSSRLYRPSFECRYDDTAVVPTEVSITCWSYATTLTSKMSTFGRSKLVIGLFSSGVK